MADIGAMGQGFFSQLDTMRDYNAQREQVKFNAQLKLKEADLQNREALLNEQLMGAKIEQAKNELRIGAMTQKAYDEYMKADKGVQDAMGQVGVTPQGAPSDAATLKRDTALSKLVGLKDPNAAYLLPQETAKNKASLGLINAQTETEKAQAQNYLATAEKSRTAGKTGSKPTYITDADGNVLSVIGNTGTAVTDSSGAVINKGPQDIGKKKNYTPEELRTIAVNNLSKKDINFKLGLYDSKEQETMIQDEINRMRQNNNSPITQDTLPSNWIMRR